MKNKEIFNWLVREHVLRDWSKIKPYVKEGILGSIEILLGKTENPYYGGILVFAKGKNLANELKKRNIVLAGKTSVSYNISTFGRFKRYCDKFRVDDGATVINKINNLAYHISVFNNNPQLFWTFKDRWDYLFKGKIKKYNLMSALPEDFITEDSTIRLSQFVECPGNKTYVAIVLPKAYAKVHTFQIKRTAYTPLGTGKVTHFDGKGLVEEFFLKYMPKHKGEFIDKEHKIVGIYRYYDRSRGVRKIFRREVIIGLSDLKNIGMN